jgi:hypothetical protein
MTSTEITTSLRNNHASFIHLIGQLNGEQLKRAQPHQWNPAQQLEHIYLSFRPVLLAFQLPRFIPRYDTLVRDYQAKLQQGGKAPAAYVPATGSNTIKRLLQLEKSVDRLCHIIDGLTEEELDRYLLPHPLLGKLTMREMLYFTSYHVTHHHKQVENILKN